MSAVTSNNTNRERYISQLEYNYGHYILVNNALFGIRIVLEHSMILY